MIILIMIYDNVRSARTSYLLPGEAPISALHPSPRRRVFHGGRGRRVCTTLHASVRKIGPVSASVYGLGHSARALCALGCRSQPPPLTSYSRKPACTTLQEMTIIFGSARPLRPREARERLVVSRPPGLLRTALGLSTGAANELRMRRPPQSAGVRWLVSAESNVSPRRG